MTRTLVLGIGNLLLRDDGVGVHVVQAMQRAALPPEIEVVDGGTSGADLVDEVARRRLVIVVDAVQADEAPGTVVRFSGELLAERAGASLSLHEFGLLETLTMAKQLGCAPERVVVFGVQPKQVSPGLELSEEVSRIIPALIDRILAEARRRPRRRQG